MIKPSRPTLWLAIVFAAGIMLVPQRGAARTDPSRWYEPGTPRIGEPDDPPDGAIRLPISMLPTYWLVNTIVKHVVDPNGRASSSMTASAKESRKK